jgi:hypothetical protein
LEENGRKLMMTLPKINYCEMRRDSEKVFLLKYLMDNLAKNGNVTSLCPLNPGCLYLRNHYVEDKSFSMFAFNQDQSEYLFMVNVTDENGKKPKSIINFSIFLKLFKTVT